jgi:PTS system ascorbate-specific IIA component
LIVSVGVLLITHDAVGEALIEAARHVMPQLPLKVMAMAVSADADVGGMRHVTSRHVRELDSGDGVLVLSDLYGATPCNIGLSVGELGAPVRCVSGLNLPMLLRVMNYAEKTLDELAEIAAAGGRGGILIDHA